MRKLYWYLSGYIQKHWWLFLMTLAAAIIIFWVILPRILDNSTFNRRTTYIGLVGTYTLTTLPDEITHQISYGLTSIDDQTWEVVPAVAEDYIISDSGLLYTFYLKNNLYWQDGTPITPDQINYNLPGVEKTIDLAKNTISYRLSEAYAPFPSELTAPLIRYDLKQRFWGLWSKIDVIGIGDYEIISYKYKDQSRTKLSQITVVSSSDKFVYRFYLTEEQAAYAFKRGEVDQVWNLNSDRGLEGWHESVVVEKLVAQDEYLGLFFNLEDKRLSKNVRQAFAYALDKGEGDQEIIGPIPADSWAFFSGVKTYQKQTQRAIERLLVDEPQESLTFTLTTASNNWSKANEIKTSLEELGDQASSACQKDRTITDKKICDNLQIQIEIKVDNFPNLNDFQLLLIGQEIADDPDQYALWHSASSSNFTHYKNTRVDSILETARQTIDQEERALLYQEFQQVFMEDPPVVFLEYIQKYDLIRN